MDFEKLQTRVEKLEKQSAAIGKGGAGAAQAMKNAAELIRDILMDFLKSRKEQVRPGHMYGDAAAKGIVPGENAQRGDNLLIRWGGRASPSDPKSVADDAAHFSTLLGGLIPVLKAYRKDEPEKKK